MTLVRPQSQTESGRKQQMSLLSIELSRERIRDLHREAGLEQEARRQIRLIRRARRDARATAIRLRHRF